MLKCTIFIGRKIDKTFCSDRFDDSGEIEISWCSSAVSFEVIFDCLIHYIDDRYRLNLQCNTVNFPSFICIIFQVLY